MCLSRSALMGAHLECMCNAPRGAHRSTRMHVALLGTHVWDAGALTRGLLGALLGGMRAQCTHWGGVHSWANASGTCVLSWACARLGWAHLPQRTPGRALLGTRIWYSCFSYLFQFFNAYIWTFSESPSNGDSLSCNKNIVPITILLEYNICHILIITLCPEIVISFYQKIDPNYLSILNFRITFLSSKSTLIN